MNNIKQAILLFFGFTMTLTAVAQIDEGSDGAVGALHVIVSDGAGYVSAMKENDEPFQLLNTNNAGFCQAVVGGEPGEALVFAYYDSLASTLAGVDVQFTDPDFQRLAAPLQPYRMLTGVSVANVLRPYSGNPLSSWAIRGVYITTDDAGQYIAAIANLETEVQANGFSDIYWEVHREIGSGSTSAQLLAIMIGPTLERLGAAMDAIGTESWGVRARTMVLESRNEIELDKIYLCETVYSANQP